MLPFFYQADLPESPGSLFLDEATSRHCIQVLRMSIGTPLLLCNGKGRIAEATVTIPERKRCGVEISRLSQNAPRIPGLSIGIAMTKNKARNEWFLEKATELGIEHIYPVLAQRSEKEKFNALRYGQILVSAMLQSQQSYLPVLHAPQKLLHFLDNQGSGGQKFIAHCQEGEKRPFSETLESEKDCVVLIGPEGDFTPREVAACLEHHFIPTSLGKTRLRTETAGLYACTVFNAFHYG